MHRAVLRAFVGVTILLTVALSAAAQVPNASRAELDTAKTARNTARAAAAAELTHAFEAQVKAIANSGNLDGLKELLAQKDAFATAGLVPNLPSMKTAAGAYELACRKADGELVAAYESFIDSAMKQQRFQDAIELRKERQKLLEGGQAPVAGSTPAETISLSLRRDKSDYLAAIEEARKAMLAAIDGRLNAEASAGRLSGVQAMTAVKKAFEEGTLPENVTDAAIVSARLHYRNAVRAANVALAGAYREAVKEYTRAKMLDQATATQAEFDATGLNAAPAAPPVPGANPGPASETSTKLARTLPSFLGATGPFTAEKEGIRAPGKTVVESRASDFLSRDFIFDVTVEVPTKDGEAIVGIGDGTDKGSLRIYIRNDGGWGRRAFLCAGDRWGKHFGDIHNGETYVMRLERHGVPITVSVGSLAGGKFTAEMSQTVSDPKAQIEGLSEKRARLFFHGNWLFTHVRLATGANASAGGSGGADDPSGLFAPVKLPRADASTPATSEQASAAPVQIPPQPAPVVAPPPVTPAVPAVPANPPPAAPGAPAPVARQPAPALPPVPVQSPTVAQGSVPVKKPTSIFDFGLEALPDSAAADGEDAKEIKPPQKNPQPAGAPVAIDPVQGIHIDDQGVMTADRRMTFGLQGTTGQHFVAEGDFFLAPEPTQYKNGNCYFYLRQVNTKERIVLAGHEMLVKRLTVGGKRVSRFATPMKFNALDRSTWHHFRIEAARDGITVQFDDQQQSVKGETEMSGQNLVVLGPGARLKNLRITVVK